MIRGLCTAILLLHTLTLSAQDKSVELRFSEFVEWLIGKHEMSVSYAHDMLLEEPIRLDTSTITIDEIYQLIDARVDIEYFLDESNRLFIRKGKSEEEEIIISNFSIFGDSEQPLSHVAISIAGSSLGGYTDERGHLKLEIPITYIEDSLTIQMIGYDDQKVSVRDLKAEISVTLSQAASMVESVLIEDRKHQLGFSRDGSTAKIEAQHVGDASDLFGKDVMRQVQTMAGVVAYQDDDSGIRIRGSEADQTLLLIDGIPLYEANHYYGIFGAINGSYIDETYLYRNNLPIQYGERNGGMVEFKSNTHVPSSSFGGQIDINLLTSSAALEGAIDSTWSYNIAGRTTYKNVSSTGLFDLFNDDSDITSVQNFTLSPTSNTFGTIPEFSFYDLNANLTFRPSNKVKLEGNFFKSHDDFKNDGSIEWPAMDGNRTNSFDFVQTEVWDNLGMSLLSSFNISKKFTLNIEGYSTQYSRENDNFADVILDNRALQRVSTINEIRETGVRSYFRFQVSKSIIASVGTDISYHDLSLRSNDIDQRRLHLAQDAWTYSAFGNAKFHITNGWYLNTGLRGTYYDVTEKTYLSPRFNFVKRINELFSIKGSLGRQYQLTQNMTFENLFRRNVDIWVMANRSSIPVTTLDHLMIGGNWRKDRWSIDIEGYYRYTKDITELALSDLSINDSGGPQMNNTDYRFYHGDGKTIGVDISANYTGRQLSSILTYTLSKNTQSFRDIAMGRWFSSQQDRRHQLQLINDLKIGDWNLGFNAVYASGMPYTDLNNIQTNSTREKVDPNTRLSNLPDYLRFDLGLGYNFKLGGMESTVKASLFNVLDRENVSYLQYMFTLPGQNNNRGTVVGTTSQLLERTLNLSWQLKF